MMDTEEDVTENVAFLEEGWVRFVEKLCKHKTFKEEGEEKTQSHGKDWYVIYFGGTWNIAVNGVCRCHLPTSKTVEDLQDLFRRLDTNFEGIPWMVRAP